MRKRERRERERERERIYFHYILWYYLGSESSLSPTPSLPQLSPSLSPVVGGNEGEEEEDVKVVVKTKSGTQKFRIKKSEPLEKVFLTHTLTFSLFILSLSLSPFSLSFALIIFLSLSLFLSFSLSLFLGHSLTLYLSHTHTHQLMKAFEKLNPTTDPKKKLMFLFDGDRVSPERTSQDLDLEDGDVLDAVYA